VTYAPHEAAVARETLEIAFLVAVQHLPPRERAGLILRDAAGFSARETAKPLGTSVPAVNSAVQRGRKRARDRLPSPRSCAPTRGSRSRRARSGTTASTRSPRQRQARRSRRAHVRRRCRQPAARIRRFPARAGRAALPSARPRGAALGGSNEDEITAKEVR
jgi:hypothetical protein